MSQQLVIDSLAFSLQGKSMAGQVQLNQCVRLLDQLERAGGALHFCLTGSVGSKGEPMLVLEISGTVVLRCQRCLEPLDFLLKVEQTFELREGLGEETLVQEDMEDDSRDFLPPCRSLDVAALIEDETLLALPVVARHASCDLPERGHNPEAASPFGVLLKFKGQSGKTH
jgi:uncharacterized protein